MGSIDFSAYGVAQIKCQECGADPAEVTPVCARCRAPIGVQHAMAGAAAAEPAQARCAECGAEPVEIAQVCVRCGAAAGPTGSPGYPVPPLPADALAGHHRSRGHSTRNALLGAGAGLAVLAAIIAVGALIRSSNPNQLAQDQLRPGDCLTGSNMQLGTDNPWPEYVTRADCNKLHSAEVIFAGSNWPQSMAFPGKDAVISQSKARCDTAFAAYDGFPPPLSAFTYDTVSPLDSPHWASGDRRLLCVAYERPGGVADGYPLDDFSIKDRFF